MLPRSFGRLRPAHAHLARSARVGRVLAAGGLIASPRSPTTRSPSSRRSSASGSCSRSPPRSSPSSGSASPRRSSSARTACRGTSRRRRGVPDPRRRRSALTFAVWVIAIATHPGARYAGPIWLAAGLVVYGLVRRSRRGAPASGWSPPTSRRSWRTRTVEDPRADEARPHRRGDDGDGREARTGARLASRGAPRDPRAARRPRRAGRPTEEERAVESLDEARLLGDDHGVVVRGTTVRARSIGDAIVEQATDQEARPDRARVGAALAAAVALLLADGRLRPPQRAVRGAGRRLPAARARGGWLV